MPLARGSAFRCLERPRIDPHELQAVCSCREGVREGHRYQPMDAKHDRGRELRRLSSSGSGVRVVGLAVDRDQSGCKYHSRGCYSLPVYHSFYHICPSVLSVTLRILHSTPSQPQKETVSEFCVCGAAPRAPPFPFSTTNGRWLGTRAERAPTIANKQRSARSLSRERYNI